MPGVKANVQARLDRRSQIALERLVRRLGWSPSRVVREGVHLLAACYVGPLGPTRHRRGAVCLGPFRSRFEQKTPARVRPVKPVLLDTGVIVALLDRSERHHARCVTVLEGLERPLVTCEAVIAESLLPVARASRSA